MRTGKAAPLAGLVFGELTVLRRAGRIRGFAAWECQCSCGAVVVVKSDLLVGGRKKFCSYKVHDPKGVLWVEYGAHAPERGSYDHMLERCYDTKRQNYRNYGGRGISVCERWRQSFRAFLEDMGPKPSKEYSIERIDNNGNYEPSNCKWATDSEQRRNKRNNVYVEYKGEQRLLIDVCAEVGASRGIVQGRLYLGWPLDEALFTPVGAKKRGPRALKGASRNAAALLSYAESLGGDWEARLRRYLTGTVDELRSGAWRPQKETITFVCSCLDAAVAREKGADIFG